MARTQVVLLCGGGVRSLVASASELSQPGAVELTLVHCRDGRPASGVRTMHAQRQADYFDRRALVELDIALGTQPAPKQRGGDAPDTAAPPMRTPRLLLAGMAQAVRQRADRLVWPMQVNNDLDAIALAAEQTVLATQLAELDLPADAATPVIYTPMLDLTDRQLVELGTQLGVPWELAWSCLLAGGQPCGACDGCQRRRRAFDAAGMIDPIGQPAHV